MRDRFSKHDKGLIKAALRRAFARSDLHREVLEASDIQHSDPTRPKVKGWRRCSVCGKPEAKSYMVVDHVSPVVPVNSSLEEMTVLEIVDAIWCKDKANLQSICPTCHSQKTARETAQRKQNKRERKCQKKT